MVVACVLGVAATWLGILLAYDSYYWIPSNKALPVSFFIVAIAFALYLISGLPIVRRHGGWRNSERQPTGAPRRAELGAVEQPT